MTGLLFLTHSLAAFSSAGWSIPAGRVWVHKTGKGQRQPGRARRATEGRKGGVWALPGERGWRGVDPGDSAVWAQAASSSSPHSSVKWERLTSRPPAGLWRKQWLRDSSPMGVKSWVLSGMFSLAGILGCTSG